MTTHSFHIKYIYQIMFVYLQTCFLYCYPFLRLHFAKCLIQKRYSLLKVDNMDNFCRLCLKSCDSLINIYDQVGLLLTIRELFRIKVIRDNLAMACVLKFNYSVYVNVLIPYFLSSIYRYPKWTGILALYAPNVSSVLKGRIISTSKS